MRHVVKIIAATGSGVAANSGGGGFSPIDLSPTAWYDPSDLTTLFQDAAGTTPVTADGDVVGLMQDKSGNGNHLTQGTTANKPLYKTDGTLHWLQFDGVDDSLSAAMDLSGTDKVSVITGLNKTSASTLIAWEHSVNWNDNAGSFLLYINDAPGREWSSPARGDAASGPTLQAYDATGEPDTAVISVTHDISGDSSTMRRNGVAGTSGTGDKGAGNFGNYTFYVGSRSGVLLFWDANIYGIILMSAIATAPQLTDTEAWMAAKSGVTL